MDINDIIEYGHEHNHKKIDLEFLSYCMQSNSEVDIENSSELSSMSNKIILTNLSWIIYYLNKDKGISMRKIHSFFIFKQWTSYKFENFRRVYNSTKKDIAPKDSKKTTQNNQLNNSDVVMKDLTPISFTDEEIAQIEKLKNRDGIDIFSSAEEIRADLLLRKKMIEHKRQQLNRSKK